MQGGKRITYDALYLDNKNTPAVLGAKSLQQTNAMLYLREGMLHMYCGDTSDFKIVADGKTYQKFQLVQASSGHLLLPCTAYDDKKEAPVKTATS